MALNAQQQADLKAGVDRVAPLLVPGGAAKTTAIKGLSTLGKVAKSFLGKTAKAAASPAGKAIIGTTAIGAVGAGTYAATRKSKNTGPTQAANPNSAIPKSNTVDVVNDGNNLDNAGNDAGRAASNLDQARRNQIGKGWDDTDDEFSSAKSALSSSQKYISNLGKVKDQYLRSNDEFKRKTDEAISGNKTLIERNQKDELDDLAGDTRRSMDNTSVMLGVKGATGGSASKAASKALQRAAGKDRASILTARGDEMSYQKQEEQNAIEQYNLRREQAYKWEEDARKQAVLEYEADKKALDRLKKKAPDWKKADIDAESDNKLQGLLANLAGISARAKTFRDTLSAKMTEFGGSADELENAAVTVDAPAELMTPDFNENIDLTTTQEAEDFFDPNNTGKTRVIKGYDAFGNPIFEDEFAAETAV